MKKYTEFTYNEKPRKLFRMVGKDEFLEGIDLSALTQEEQVAFDILTEEFKVRMEPYMKAYRRFDPKKIS